eukprot:Hpha_TRINITY_DN15055_c4_g6::TRINITY_DN15055_c4_g6_i1::g.126237::m.126237
MKRRAGCLLGFVIVSGASVSSVTQTLSETGSGTVTWTPIPVEVNITPRPTGYVVVSSSLPIGEQTLLNADTRISRSQRCFNDEIAAVAASESLSDSSLSRCWRDDCICRGGSWDLKTGLCSHLCVGIVCKDAGPCRTPGPCDLQTGLCTEEHLPDGEPCKVHNSDPHHARCLRGVCMLPPVQCGGRICESPEDAQCQVVSCTETWNVTTGRANTSCVVEKRPDGAECSDGNMRTLNDACHSGVCLGTLRDECDATPPELRPDCTAPPGAPRIGGNDSALILRIGPGPCTYTLGECDPTTGHCRETPAADGTPCNDHNPLTLGDVCVLGACTGYAICSDDDSTLCFSDDPQCVTATCLAGTCGRGPQKPDGTACNDGRPETYGDSCLGGRCIGTAAFYGCPNHASCFRDMLTCLRDAVPSCYPFYQSQCWGVSTHQRCHPALQSEFCVTATSASNRVTIVLALAVLCSALLFLFD